MSGGEKEEQKEIEELKQKLEECERQRAEYLAGWQRARADFLNYKKEEMERIQALIGYAKEEFILKILPVLDNFDQAEKKILESLKTDYNVKGILQIRVQLLDFLKQTGVEEMKVIGQKFNPHYHEVVEEEKKEGAENGVILGEIQKGYIANGRVLRPAKVKVAK